MKVSVWIVVLCLVVTLFTPVKEAAAIDWIETGGDVGMVAIPATAALLTLVRGDREGSIQFVETFATAAAASLALKYTVQERRPNGGDHSFPSFHTAAAFSGAGFIQQRYGWQEGALAYAAAAFVGYSRVESRNHYFKDVLAGAAIGVLSSLIFTTGYKDVTVTPVAGKDLTGVIIGKSF
ncbi:MAG: phosphatase PAP2 family protein [Nitrospirales bacterium]|nr:phosphatase PAP2 family protein [Nitrospirales bacterium]